MNSKPQKEQLTLLRILVDFSVSKPCMEETNTIGLSLLRIISSITCVENILAVVNGKA